MVKTLWDHTYYIPASKAKTVKPVRDLIIALGGPFSRVHSPVIVTSSVGGLYPYDTKDARGTAIAQWVRAHLDVWSTQRPLSSKAMRRALIERISLYRFAVRQRFSQLRGEFALWGEFYESNVVYANNKGEVVPLFEAGRAARRRETRVTPIFLERGATRADPVDGVAPSFLAVRFNRVSRVASKSIANSGALVVKQKRAKVPNMVPIRILSEELDPLYAVKNYLAPAQPTLYASGFMQALEIHVDPLLQNDRPKNKLAEVMSVSLSRRLLRTQSTLVLPAQVNLTLITNSYDVVHS
jgi:hypothetical protein